MKIRVRISKIIILKCKYISNCYFFMRNKTKFYFFISVYNNLLFVL